MNTNQLRKIAKRGELGDPIILQNKSGYLVGYELEQLELMTSINSKQTRCFKRLDSALAAASSVEPLDQVTFRQTTIEVPVNE